jgi:uncharacterized protein YehS (DUF1456 family)
MNNNDLLKSIRYTFDFGDDKMMKLFENGGLSVSRSQVCEWLKKEEDADFKEIIDSQLAAFLNGFIIEKRGRREGEQPVAEKKLNNNIILRKLKIALSLRDEDIIELLQLSDFRLGKAELSAFFRNPSQSQYRPCKDQIIRVLMQGLRQKYRPSQMRKE